MYAQPLKVDTPTKWNIKEHPALQGNISTKKSNVMRSKGKRYQELELSPIPNIQYSLLIASLI
jgi:hypothetical protein